MPVSSKYRFQYLSHTSSYGLYSIGGLSLTASLSHTYLFVRGTYGGASPGGHFSAIACHS
jgi:hypothetical protein